MARNCGRRAPRPARRRPGRSASAPSRAAAPRCSLSDRADLVHRDRGTAREQEPLPRRVRHAHRQDVRGGHVPHVDDRDVEVREAGHRAVAACVWTRWLAPEMSRAHDRAHDGDGQHRGELQRAALAGDEVPRGALGERLALAVGVDAGPSSTVQSASVKTWSSCGWPQLTAWKAEVSTTRLTPASRGRAQHPQRALARRDDEVVLVLDVPRLHRRRDVQHGVDAGDAPRPSRRRSVGRRRRSSARRRRAMPASARTARTAASLPSDRTVVRTSYPCSSSCRMQCPAMKPEPPVTRTRGVAMASSFVMARTVLATARASASSPRSPVVDRDQRSRTAARPTVKHDRRARTCSASSCAPAASW